MWGVGIVTQTILFERGILGLVGGVVRALEIAMILSIIFWVDQELSPRPGDALSDAQPLKSVIEV
jgi:hypothetical protein